MDAMTYFVVCFKLILHPFALPIPQYPMLGVFK